MRSCVARRDICENTSCWTFRRSRQSSYAFTRRRDPRLADAFAYCAAKTRNNAKNFYYAFMVLPRRRREAMYALYCFCREADDAVDEAGEVAAKRAALDQLRDGLDRCFADRPEGPMFEALAAVRSSYGLSKQHLDDVVTGCEMDLDTTRYETFADLAIYLDRVASAVGRATMELFGVSPEGCAKYATAGGHSVQLTNILRDVKEDLTRDRIYLPQEDLKRFSVTESDLRNERLSDGFLELMAFEVARTRGLYQKAREVTSDAQKRALLPLTTISRIYERVLDRIEARSYDVFSERVSLPGWRKAFLGLDTWLKARLHLPIGR
ncbi:phytoene/squalene synthase family protein [Planctomycetota bacterium]